MVLFTDGFPDDAEAALQTAAAMREQGSYILAIGTGDADRSFLAELTGDRRLVVWARSGAFERAFAEAGAIIERISLLDSVVSPRISICILRVGAWTAIVAACLGLALIAAQNHYLRRRLLSWSQLAVGGACSLLAGCAAGTLGQVLFLIARTTMAEGLVLSLLLGLLLGAAVTTVVAKQRRATMVLLAAVGGSLGLFAALEFYFSVPTTAPFHYPAAVPAWALIGVALGCAGRQTGAPVASMRASRIGAQLGVLAVALLILVRMLVGDSVRCLVLTRRASSAGALWALQWDEGSRGISRTSPPESRWSLEQSAVSSAELSSLFSKC